MNKKHNTKSFPTNNYSKKKSLISQSKKKYRMAEKDKKARLPRVIP